MALRKKFIDSGADTYISELRIHDRGPAYIEVDRKKVDDRFRVWLHPSFCDRLSRVRKTAVLVLQFCAKFEFQIGYAHHESRRRRRQTALARRISECLSWRVVVFQLHYPRIFFPSVHCLSEEQDRFFAAWNRLQSKNFVIFQVLSQKLFDSYEEEKFLAPHIFSRPTDTHPAWNPHPQRQDSAPEGFPTPNCTLEKQVQHWRIGAFGQNNRLWAETNDHFSARGNGNYGIPLVIPPTLFSVRDVRLGTIFSTTALGITRKVLFEEFRGAGVDLSLDPSPNVFCRTKYPISHLGIRWVQQKRQRCWIFLVVLDDLFSSMVCCGGVQATNKVHVSLTELLFPALWEKNKKVLKYFRSLGEKRYNNEIRLHLWKGK